MTLLKFLRFIRSLLTHLALVSLILEQFLFVSVSAARAADLPITPDGSTNTQIDRAANNVPIVNIAAPNSGGLSHNKFNDYNVNQQGLILNNATGSQNGVVQTQIGGLINDNANLKNSGAASIILNEVTSNNVSHINGYTEIAGRKADLILANPNGFVMNGAGFINTSRLTTIVGSSNQHNPNPADLTFSLSNHNQIASGFLPKLTIQGSGIDLESVSATDLVASMMEIVAPIYGANNEVNLRTGDQAFNYASKAVTSDNTNPGSNLESQLAIDASALGKIQAGRIYIIASKEGFGIKWDADMLASRSGINIDNQGNITYKNLASEAGNIEVTSRKGAITQNGISQTKDSASDVKLNAFGNIINSGQFVSARNINLETSATFRNESSAINFSSNDFTIKAADLVNLGVLAANRDLSVDATASITNSKELVSGRTLTLNAPQITNSDSIYSSGKIAITATDNLTNNKDIIALGTDADDGIIINAKTLNNNQRIAANKNITINSDALNNNNADSIILALNNVNLSATSLNNSGGNVQAFNTLALRNLKLNAPDTASLFGITSQATSVTNIGGSLFAGSLLDIDLGNYSDYTIVGNLESAGSIKIKANNITNQTNLQANGAIEITATDKFVNGVLSGDNTNNKIIAGTNLSITAANLLSNYSVLSSNNDLTLTSTNNNINNNINAEIIGGTGKLTLSAKNGAVYQNSLHSLVSNGDLTLDVTDFDNTGRVDIAGDFTLNVANNLTNAAGALIYSGGDMELNVVNNLTNNSGAVIYSEGDLTIQKYALTNPLYSASNNKSNLVKNISGQIISYDGDMRIDATTISNERAINPFNSVLNPQTNGTIYGASSGLTNQYSWQLNNDGCFGHNCENRYWGYYAKQLTNSGSIASWIQSGGTLTVNAGTLDNLASNISATGNITINANTLNNHSINDPGLYYMVTTWGSRDVYSLGTTTYIRHDPGNGGHSGSRLNYSNFAQNNPSTIKSGGSITLNVTNNVSNATTNSNTSTSAIATQTPQITNSLDVEEVTTNGTITVDLTRYFSGPSENGLFQKSTNPNGPLFETRSQFIDQSKFFGSDYFYTRIGLNLTDVQTEFEQTSKRLVGDQFFQTKIIEEQLKTISKNSVLLSSSQTNTNNEIKSLLDNAADEYARLGLTANSNLTQAQINSLQKDIIWFETQTIDGAVYIVPKIYLSQSTRDNLKNGNMTNSATIYAAGDVNINSSSGKITNAGSVTGNNVTLSASGDILNKNFSNITASNALSLTSSAGSISNFSQLKASGALSLSAAKDVTNSSTVLTNDSSLLASGISGYVSNGMGSSNNGYIQSKTLETAGITAGSLTINAGNDFTNQAANITTTGNANITAGNDTTFSTLQLRNRTEESWGHKSKGGSRTTDTTTNVASNIDIGGNLNVKTTGLSSDSATDGGSNINVKGSNITTDGNLTLAAKDEVNVTSAVDSSYKMETSNKKGLTYSVSSTSVNSNTKNISSNLTSGGDVAISSGKDTNIIASNITGEGSGTITAGSYIDYDTGSATYGQTITNSDAQVNILSAKDTTYSYSETIKVKTELNATNIAVAAAAIGGAFFTGGATLGLLAATGSYSLTGAVEHDKSTTTKGSTTETIVKSNLSFGNELTIASASDLTVKASNLTTEQGDISLTSGGDINILSDTETNSSYQHGSTNGLFGSNKQQKVDTNSTTNVASVITAGSDKTSVNGNLELTSVDNTTLQAAKLNANKDITLTVGENLMILAATNSSSTSYTNNDETTFNFTNGSSGNFNTEVINTEILAGANSSSGGSAGNLAVNVGGNILAQYNAKSGEVAATPTTGINDSTLARDFSATPELAYINALNPTKTQYQSLDEISQSWDQTTRGLTETGTAVVAVAAVAATIATAGAAGAAVATSAGMVTTAGALTTGGMMVAAGTAVAITTAAATFAVSATNASLNADNLGNIDDVAKTSVKETTSKDSLKNIAIASVTSALTAGIAEVSGLNDAVRAADAASAAGNTTTMATQMKIALAESAISNTTSTLVQSAISNDSSSDMIKNLATNIAVGAFSNAAAKQIGAAAHAGTISKPEQLALHAGLGATTAALTGNDALSGAVSGVVGEVVAENYKNQKIDELLSSGKGVTQNDIDQIIQNGSTLAELAGGFSSIISGQFSGQNDHEVAQNIWSGSRIGKNAAENNALDTVYDALVVAYDVGKIGYGYYTDDKGMVKEGFYDLTADSAAFAMPFVPAGSTKLARLVGKGEDVTQVTKQGSKLPGDHSQNFLDQSYTNRQVSGDEVFYKYHGTDNRTGKEITYVTNNKYSSEEQLRQGLAIDKDWGTIDKVTTFKPQKGTWISEGFAAPQKSISQQVYKGGDYQGAIDTKNLPKSTIIRTDKLPNGF